MTKHTILLCAILTALPLALVACGSGATRLGADRASLAPPAYKFHVSADAQASPTPYPVQAPSLNYVPEGLSVAGAAEPAAELKSLSTLRGIDPSRFPKLPADKPLNHAQPLKRGSTLHSVDLSAYWDKTAEADTSGGQVVLASAAADITWAIYAIPLDEYEVPLNVNIQGTLDVSANGADSGVVVAVPNYTRGCWEICGTYPMSPASAFNYPGTYNYVSPAKNAYMLLLTYNGDAVTVTGLTINTMIIEPLVLPAEWDIALGNAGLGPGTPGMSKVFGEGLTYGGFGWGGYTDLQTMLPTYFDMWYASVGSTPAYMKTKNNELRDATGLQELLLNAQNEFPADRRTTQQAHSETLDPTDPLAVAIADFVSAAGGIADLPAYKTALAPLNMNAQNALAAVIYAERHALDLRETALSGMSFTPSLLADYFNWAHGDPTGSGVLLLKAEQAQDGVWDVTTGNLMLRYFDYAPFFEGACYLADALDDLSAYMAASPVLENVSLSVDTPVGAIVIGGTGDDNHTAPLDGNGHALLVDLGGADTYNCHAGGTASSLNGVALCLDLGGNDIYRALDDATDVDRTVVPSNDNTSQQGAGRFGSGMLVDYGGDDQYYSVRLSQGSCVFGVGLLADMGNGVDAYEMEALGQGGAFAGVAVLYDQGGNDQYKAWNKCQGFGSLMGVGYLIDQGAETDNYFAQRTLDPTKPEYFDGTLGSNISNCQGAAMGATWGWLAAYTTPTEPNGEVGGGGMGILFDGGGDDTYECGALGQGSGYYQSVGMLLDNGGNDTHTGYTYTQAAGLHVAVGLLRDGGGNDSYLNDAEVGVCGAENASITWLYELAGDDTYDCDSNGLAGGLANGFAYFLDLAGNDSYSSHFATFQDSTLGVGLLGSATWPAAPTIGVLLDLIGVDTYAPGYAMMLNSTGLPMNGQSWVRSDPAYLPGKGSGLDI